MRDRKGELLDEDEILLKFVQICLGLQHVHSKVCASHALVHFSGTIIVMHQVHQHPVHECADARFGTGIRLTSDHISGHHPSRPEGQQHLLLQRRDLEAGRLWNLQGAYTSGTCGPYNDRHTILHVGFPQSSPPGPLQNGLMPGLRSSSVLPVKKRLKSLHCHNAAMQILIASLSSPTAKQTSTEVYAASQ